MAPIPGWYVDAMEQNLGMLITQQRDQNVSVEDMVALLMDPTTGDGRSLSENEHKMTLALCVTICVRRLARVDMPQ